ncbi:molybdate transport system substrate-binding protein [Arcanobacterium pluranimalium]|uniref:molybdate ABC transporter substrate-binding protein n=1 Tax=Arcanobacterium pluranimalium TaxID=108028 RepID=UPI00195E1ED3|nr:molybdate ABC transporter substrate-binding protein [Arcanobacterium pluranimalium]MBM7824542.1 molybdate transport system substrate-binding protein [Arcanobacterium pluranimalium]
MTQHSRPHSKRTRTFVIGFSLVASVVFGACSTQHTNGKAEEANGDGAEITVFAAASLSAAFPEIAEKVLANESAHTKVTFSFEGSSSLAEQIKNGAPVDVFASADEGNMKKVSDFVNSPEKFASNTLSLIVPASNPARVDSVADLHNTKLVVCAEQVPCGKATKQLEKRLGITLEPVSQEQNVTSVRTKVESAEADAGFVYRTDAQLAGDKVKIVDVPQAAEVSTTYVIASLKNGSDSAAAQAFINAVKSPAGQEILRKHGFDLAR